MRVTIPVARVTGGVTCTAGLPGQLVQSTGYRREISTPAPPLMCRICVTVPASVSSLNYPMLFVRNLKHDDLLNSVQFYRCWTIIGYNYSLDWEETEEKDHVTVS